MKVPFIQGDLTSLMRISAGKKIILFDTSYLFEGPHFLKECLTSEDKLPVVPDFIYKQLRTVSTSDKLSKEMRAAVLKVIRTADPTRYVILITDFWQQDGISPLDLIDDSFWRRRITEAASAGRKGQAYEDGSEKKAIDRSDQGVLCILWFLIKNGISASLLTNDRAMRFLAEEIERENKGGISLLETS